MGPIERMLTDDHARLEGLLTASVTAEGTIDGETYARFRHDLLRHIAMEEKVLLPFAREQRGGAPLPVAARLRRDHGAIAKLLVRSPTLGIVEELRALLRGHDAVEEGPDGLYATCDALAGDAPEAVIAALHAQPNVPVAKYYDGPLHARRKTGER